MPTTPDRLPAGELQATREYLGFTLEDMAEKLNVRPDTVRHWELGRDPIPYRVREEVAAIEAATDAAVEQIVNTIRGTTREDTPRSITIYRKADELPWTLRDWPPRWWRHVAKRAAMQVPGAPILNATEAQRYASGETHAPA